MIKFKRLFALAMALTMIFSLSLTASAASADDALIDPSKTGSIDIYKYDLSNAEKDGENRHEREDIKHPRKSFAKHRASHPLWYPAAQKFATFFN